MQATYSEEQIKDLRDELSEAGFRQITEAMAVETAIKSTDYVIYVINSVCCCAANNARPAAISALNLAKSKGLNVAGVTSFAGADIDAVNKFRLITSEYRPSSPCIAIFKKGKLISMVERKNIDKSSKEKVLELLEAAFD